MRKTLNYSLPFGLLLIVLFLSSCTVKLAPRYDEAILKGLNEVSAQSLELFASGSSGFPQSVFDETEKRYNEIIGKVESLMLQSAARPVPENTVLKKINKKLIAQGRQEVDFSNDLPSTSALQQISEQFKKMKDTHRKRAISATEVVVVFKGNVKILLDQALTFESFLER